MSDDDPGYTGGYYGSTPSWQYKGASWGWWGAKQRELDDAERRRVAEQSHWNNRRRDETPRVAGETLYKLLALIVAVFVGWFGFTLATRMGLSSGFELTGLVTGAIGGWWFVHIFKSPLIAIFAVIETLIRWALGIGIVIFIIWLLNQ